MSARDADEDDPLACTATLACGPGHQSTVRCERKDAHHTHFGLGRSWCGEGQTFSGFFDEDPVCDH